VKATVANVKAAQGLCPTPVLTYVKKRSVCSDCGRIQLTVFIYTSFHRLIT